MPRAKNAWPGPRPSLLLASKSLYRWRCELLSLADFPRRPPRSLGGMPSIVTLSAAKGLTRWAQRSFAALRMTFSVERGSQSGRPGHTVNAYEGPYGRPLLRHHTRA